MTFDGVSLGSTATYTTNERYLVNRSQTFMSRCGNDNWVLPSQGIVAGNVIMTQRGQLIIVLFSQFVCRMIYCRVTIQLLPLLVTICCVVIAIVYVQHTLGLPMAVLQATLLLKTIAS